MSQPDLFVVCRNCGSEVSPYVTECPYCGQRVRKRAPRIERPDEEGAPRSGKRRRRPSRPSFARRTETGLPVAPVLLVALSALASILLSYDDVGVAGLGGIFVPLEEDAWRYLTAPFIYNNLIYQFVALAGVAVFATALERRAGPVLPVLVFLIAGAAGAAAAVAAGVSPPFESSPLFAVLGGNGAALGLLAVWLLDVRRESRGGREQDVDLLGAGAFAAVLLLLPFAVPEASVVAGVTGAVVGLVIGVPLAAIRARR